MKQLLTKSMRGFRIHKPPAAPEEQQVSVNKQLWHGLMQFDLPLDVLGPPPTVILRGHLNDNIQNLARPAEEGYPHLTDDAFVAAHRDEWLRA